MVGVSLVFAVERLEEAGLDETRHEPVTDRQQEENDEREDHLHVDPRSEAEQTHHEQLYYLAPGELVNFALRHAPDVVVRRIGGLAISISNDRFASCGTV